MLKLCNFLSEEFTSRLFDVKPVENPGKTPLVHQPIQPENAGKWHSKMSSWEVRAFENVAGDTLNDFGYELVSSADPLYFPMPILYKLQNKLLHRYFKIIGR